MNEQQVIKRRLTRMAASMNRRAIRYGAPGFLRWTDLYYLGQACWYCGIGLEPMHGTYDHVTPLERGGSNTRENLARCCTKCQREKASRLPAEFLQSKHLQVTCALPGCDVTFTPRYSEWKRGMARYCSLSHSAKGRWANEQAS